MVGRFATRPGARLSPNHVRIRQAAQAIAKDVRACSIEKVLQLRVAFRARQQGVDDVEGPPIADSGYGNGIPYSLVPTLSPSASDFATADACM